jgi:hypothetical protein
MEEGGKDPVLLFLNGIKMSNVQENLGDRLLAVVALLSMQSKKFPAKGWVLNYSTRDLRVHFAVTCPNCTYLT